MLLFPDCKINLGLYVLSRRKDGYHDIDTVMYPVRGLCDALEIISSERDGVEFSSSGLPTDGAPDDNLCVKAYRAVCRDYAVGGVRMHLHKHIPMGAGLGGGSSDAAFVIRGLSELFGLGLDTARMEALAAGIGSDTAFFVADRPAFARGRGEILSPAPRVLSGYRLVLVKPDEHVSTAEAYRHVVPADPEVPLAEALRLPVRCWREYVRNDFEPSVFRAHPLLREIKEQLYGLGAAYASMSGSGSALYALFDGEAPDLSVFGDLFVYQEDMV